MTHPYFPITAHLPGYVPQEAHFTVILSVVGGIAAAVFAAVWLNSGTLERIALPRFGWIISQQLAHGAGFVRAA